MKKNYLMMAALLQLGFFCGLSSVAFAVDALPLKVGSLEIYPALQIQEEHDDNIFAQETTEISSWITTIDPAVKAVIEKGTSSFEADYRFSKGIYHSSGDDDYSDHFVDLKASFAPTSRLAIDGWVTYNNTHDRRGSTFTGQPIFFNSPDQYHETLLGGKVSYGVNARFDAEAEYTNKRYDNHQIITQTRDLDTTGGRASLSLPIAPKTSAVVEARYKRFDYNFLSATTNLDSNEQRYFVGLDWEATAKTTGTLRAGYLQKNFSTANLDDDSQFSWELGVLWEPMSYSSWELTGSDRPVESDGTGAYTRSKNVDLSWKHEWSGFLSHTASVGYSNNDFKGKGLAALRTDKITSIGLSLDYDFWRWLTVGAGYDYTNRNSNAANASYRKNVWFLRLQGTL